MPFVSLILCREFGISCCIACRKELQQRREGSVQTEASEHLPQLLAAWRIQGDPGGSATDILLCQ